MKYWDVSLFLYSKGSVRLVSPLQCGRDWGLATSLSDTEDTRQAGTLTVPPLPHRHQCKPAANFHFNHFFYISYVVTWSGGASWQHCHRIVLFVNSLGMECLGLNLSSDRVNSLFFTLNQRMKNNLSGNCE